ncbi:MAG TPA: hypothetical protein VFH01_01925 [Pyrinomonadaceae bacterium]|nr:hypothetical protein [Pyrinomonadaceae bacterium]
MSTRSAANKALTADRNQRAFHRQLADDVVARPLKLSVGLLYIMQGSDPDVDAERLLRDTAG